MPKVQRLVIVIAQAGFWLALGVWSWLLVKPNPFPETAKELNEWAFIAAKLLHAGCYAVLTLWVWFGWSGRVQQWLFALVVLHGVASEVGQYLGNQWYQTGRYGCFRDVFIDWFGVSVVLVVRWLWSRKQPGKR
jgi:VanZ family protein